MLVVLFLQKTQKLNIMSKIKHGDAKSKSRHPLYRKWCSMKRRCHNSNASDYKDYGSRGISVCSEWRNNYEAFKKWALSSGYEIGLTIERIDNNGNYEPSNCTWITKGEQASNRRTALLIEYNGKVKSATEWAKEIGLNRRTIYDRHYRGLRGNDLFAISKGNECAIKSIPDGLVFPSITKAANHYNVSINGVYNAIRCKDGQYKGIQFVKVAELEK